jgi:hypothetical protein
MFERTDVSIWVGVPSLKQLSESPGLLAGRQFANPLPIGRFFWVSWPKFSSGEQVALGGFRCMFVRHKPFQWLVLREFLPM